MSKIRVRIDSNSMLCDSEADLARVIAATERLHEQRTYSMVYENADQIEYEGPAFMAPIFPNRPSIKVLRIPASR